MADNLVPLLTGATRYADEYLWTLIGLRWAREDTGSSVDATIFNQGFAPFERALKQYWYHFQRRLSSGINVVKKLCSEAQPNVRRPILVDQRATGLLGSYIVSLRGMGLVQKDSLRVVEDAADRLLVDIKFAPPKNWRSSWDALYRAFFGIELKSARRRLGICLFAGGSPAMTRAAQSVLKRPGADSWARLGRAALDNEQARLANATTALIGLERAALDAFGCMLRGEKSVPQSTRKVLCSRAAATRDADPFPSTWIGSNPLRSAIGDALSLLARGRNPADALLRLHITVTRELRQTEPWLLHLGDPPAAFQRWRPGESVPDLRFGNLRTLVHQTSWRRHGA